jgi:Zn-dependent protease with chaperone function
MAGHGREFWRRAGAIVLVAVLCTSCAGTTATTGGAQSSARVMDFAVPGKNYRLRMPPEHMRERIHQLMQAGRAPRYLQLHPRELRRRCPGTIHILACTKSVRNLKVIYVSSLLKDEELQMVLVHEFAHYLYDWKH